MFFQVTAMTKYLPAPACLLTVGARRMHTRGVLAFGCCCLWLLLLLLLLPLGREALEQQAAGCLPLLDSSANQHSIGQLTVVDCWLGDLPAASSAGDGLNETSRQPSRQDSGGLDAGNLEEDVLDEEVRFAAVKGCMNDSPFWLR